MNSMPRAMRNLFLSLALTAVPILQAHLGAAPQAPLVLEGDDGPHVLWKGESATVFRLRSGKVEPRKEPGPFELELQGMAAAPLPLSPAPVPAAKATYALPERILAVSDVHGRFDSLLRLLKAQKVIDEHLAWRFGAGHLVVVGDTVDRGPQMTEALWFLRGLEAAASKAGGRVHVLLGNHEIMLMRGDLRYAHPKYLRAAEAWPTLAEQYGINAELGRWLRSRPVLLKLGPILFLHGGLSPEFIAQRRTLDEVNRELRASIGEKAKADILGASGPVWYRGFLPEGGSPQASEEEIKNALEAFGAKSVVVGHTTLDRIGVYHGGRVFGIDAGMKDGRPGEAWIWDKRHAWRGTADGARERLLP